MSIKYFQKGFNYSQDGPGNRLVIHLSGCNLRCPWCSNPEGIYSAGKETSAEALTEEILSCKRLFIDGGGVTFTGGECTLQADVLKRVLAFCKKNGIHTAIETNGTFKMPERFYHLIDLIISDFKHYDEEKLKDTIGMQADYKHNVSEYIKKGKRVLIRTVLINGFNTKNDDAEKFAKFFDQLPCDKTEFEFLPYHEYGKSKWFSLGKDYAVKDGFVTQDIVKHFESVYKRHCLNVVRY